MLKRLRDSKQRRWPCSSRAREWLNRSTKKREKSMKKKRKKSTNVLQKRLKVKSVRSAKTVYSWRLMAKLLPHKPLLQRIVSML